jgi:hypothetical protein
MIKVNDTRRTNTNNTYPKIPNDAPNMSPSRPNNFYCFIYLTKHILIILKNRLISVKALLLHILGVPGSNVSQETGEPQSLQANAMK